MTLHCNSHDTLKSGSKSVLTKECKKWCWQLPYHLRKPLLPEVYTMQFNKCSFFPASQIRALSYSFLCHGIKNIFTSLYCHVYNTFIGCWPFKLISLRVYAARNSFDWYSNVWHLTDLFERHNNSYKRIETTWR